MTVDSSIGADDPRTRESGIDDETLAEEEGRKARQDGDAAMHEKPGDLTAEHIARGNDHNVSADTLGRAPKSNKLSDDGIEIGKP